MSNSFRVGQQGGADEKEAVHTEDAAAHRRHGIGDSQQRHNVDRIVEESIVGPELHVGVAQEDPGHREEPDAMDAAQTVTVGDHVKQLPNVLVQREALEDDSHAVREHAQLEDIESEVDNRMRMNSKRMRTPTI